MPPDITMCSDHNCPQKEDCYRYNAKPSEYAQSYFVDSPYDKNNNKCNYFWDMNLYQKIKDESKGNNL